MLTEGGSDHAAVTERIRIAASAFYNLERRFLHARQVLVRTKVRIFQATITAQLLYGWETWCLGEHTTRKLRSFQQHVLRHILRRHMRVHIGPDVLEEYTMPGSEEILARVECDDIVHMVQYRPLRYHGHIMRRAATDDVGAACTAKIYGPVMRGLILSKVMKRERLRHIMASVHLQDDEWGEVAHPNPHFGAVELPRGPGRDAVPLLKRDPREGQNAKKQMD